MVDDATFADLSTTVHRLEAKVDVALTQTQARVDEHGRILQMVMRDRDDHDARLRAVESTRDVHTSQIDAAAAAIRALTDRVTGYRAPVWPAILSSVVGAVGLILAVAAVLYSTNGSV